MPKHLIIDWGNTRVKVAIFNGEALEHHFIEPAINPDWLHENVPGFEHMHVLVCSVTQASMQIEAFLEASCQRYVKLTHQTPLPIVMAYQTPETLGYDRLANAVAAQKFTRKGYHSLAIDVGTCLKFDFVHAADGYLGGSISPGLRMRFSALNHFTDALPLVKPRVESELIGASTQGSIESGVMIGMLSEIECTIQRYRALYAPMEIYLTGGDAQFFEKALKNIIFAHSFLTLHGLNDILEFND